MRVVLKEFAEGAFHDFFGDFFANEAGEGGEAVDGSFKLPNVIKDVFGDEEGDFMGKADTAEFGFMLEDGDAGFEVWNADMSDEAPFHTTDESFGELELGGRFIGGDDDLFVLVDQTFKGIAELIFKIESILEELDIVNEQEIK